MDILMVICLVVFSPGELGPFASMDSEVKIVTDSENFDTTFDEDEKEMLGCKDMVKITLIVIKKEKIT
jgi:hypothetical protein